MPDDLRSLVDQFLTDLKRRSASPNTVEHYGRDLAAWLEYMTPPSASPPEIGSIDRLLVREWLGHLFNAGHDPASVKRRLAALRSFFTFLQRTGRVEVNVARLVRTPKVPIKLPVVPDAGVTNGLIDQVPSKAEEEGRRFPERDLVIFELLYGCGIRISELAGLDVEHLQLGERWLRVRGKGNKERDIPFSEGTAAAILRYLEKRKPAPRERALLLNHHGKRLSVRGIRKIVHHYADAFTGDSSLHPHTFRHAYATHLLADGADLRAIQELLGHARLSTTQLYTQVALTDLMRVYDKCHPKA
jgi:integrase/recombinase XerC